MYAASQGSDEGALRASRFRLSDLGSICGECRFHAAAESRPGSFPQLASLFETVWGKVVTFQFWRAGEQSVQNASEGARCTPLALFTAWVHTARRKQEVLIILRY